MRAEPLESCYTFPMSTSAVIHLFATLIIIGQVTVGLFILTWFGRNSWAKKLHDGVGSYALLGAFVVALLSTGGSLYFSEVAKIAPCELCWFQRILMYPQVILLGLALLKKNRDIFYSSMTLSIFGAMTAVYHYYLQRGGNPLVPCSTVGFSVDCSKNFTLDYGYITIPVMALTGFVMIIVAMVLHQRSEKMSSSI